MHLPSWLRLTAVLAPFILAAWTERDAADEPGGDPADLVRRIQAGDPDAESELVARFSRGLLLMLRRLARNPALADDLHQETLALVIEKIRRGEVREPDKLAAFLRSTARNLFIADRRKEARYQALDEEGGKPGPALSDRGPAAFERVVAEEEARQVQRLLGELRHDRRLRLTRPVARGLKMAARLLERRQDFVETAHRLAAQDRARLRHRRQGGDLFMIGGVGRGRFGDLVHTHRASPGSDAFLLRPRFDPVGT